MTMGKLVYGVGLNDAGYVVKPTVNGIRKYCPYYKAWTSMLRRCYQPKFIEKFPSYADVNVCDDWKTFSKFKGWMEQQDWEGKELDKDIINFGSKGYSPENCCFIPHALNVLLLDRANDRGLLPLGVYLCKKSGKYKAQCNYSGKREGLGAYDTVQKAQQAYNKRKAEIVLEVAEQQPDSRVSEGLRYYVKEVLGV